MKAFASTDLRHEKCLTPVAAADKCVFAGIISDLKRPYQFKLRTHHHYTEATLAFIDSLTRCKLIIFLEINKLDSKLSFVNTIVSSAKSGCD